VLNGERNGERAADERAPDEVAAKADVSEAN
jgi:hypothetical protein